MNRLVVAYDQHRAIGKNGDLPWAGKLPADMRHFKDLTEGTSVIMGRKTFESLPERFRPLPNRENIVVSLSQRAIEGALTVTSINEAFATAGHEAVVIGGGQIYTVALPYIDRIDATEINTEIDGADTHFPELSPDEWELASYQLHSADSRNQFDHAFATYLRRQIK